MFRRQHRSHLLCAFLTGTSLLLLGARVRHLHNAQPHPLGRLTAEQVLRMSQPICQAIAPQPDSLSLSAEPPTDVVKAWTVLCKDSAGREIVYLTWSASTGQLCYVGAIRKLEIGDQQALNAREAVKAARSWLDLLGLPCPASQFHIVPSSLSRGKHIWSIQWRAGRQNAFIQVGLHSGNLVYAEIWQEPTPSPKLIASNIHG